MTTIDGEKLRDFVNGYEETILKNVTARADEESAPSWYVGEVSSVLNALMSRQATLTIHLSRNPLIWNGHIAPLILRSMIDAVITFRWILKDQKSRSQEFIGYGLGQAKLAMSHLEKKLGIDPADSAVKSMMTFKEAWISSQRWMAFVDVNLGSWSGKSVRQMAIEADDEDLYHFSFTPFSSCVHNQWDHIHIYNTELCNNPLHKWHRIPAIAEDGIIDDYLFRSAKYFDLMTSSFDETAGMSRSLEGAREYFRGNIGSIYSDDAGSEIRGHST